MKQSSKDKLASLIKNLRSNTSQRQFAKSLNVSFASVQAWESGDSMPSTENLAAIASKAGYTIEGLIAHLDDQPMPKTVGMEQIIMQIRVMPAKELAMVGHALSDRLVAIAEAS